MFSFTITAILLLRIGNSLADVNCSEPFPDQSLVRQLLYLGLLGFSSDVFFSVTWNLLSTSPNCSQWRNCCLSVGWRKCYKSRISRAWGLVKKYGKAFRKNHFWKFNYWKIENCLSNFTSSLHFGFNFLLKYFSIQFNLIFFSSASSIAFLIRQI